LFTAFLTFGEGYHNYHHEFASDYRNGPRWYDWDPSKWIIKALSYAGLTYNLKTIREEIIVRKRMQMKEKRMRSKLEGSNFNFFGSQDFKVLEQLKENMEKTFKDLSRLHDQYQSLTKSLKLQDKTFNVLEANLLQDQINEARAKFFDYVSKWNLMRRRVLAYAGA
jgi:stearoyl-CoA desaturase (delta-9 desaturase)